MLTTETELLARALGADLVGCTELATRYGSLRNVPDAELHGVNLTRDRIEAVAELAAVYAAPTSEVPAVLRSSADVFARLNVHMATLDREEFHVLLLDQKHRVLRDVTVSVGSLSQSIVHPREVFRTVVLHSAAAIILAHNHPSGDPTPSQEDIAITRRLRECGELLGVRVLDHIVIGRGSFVSMVEQGYW